MPNLKVGRLSGVPRRCGANFPVLPPVPAGCYQAHLDLDALTWVEDGTTQEMQEIAAEGGHRILQLKLRGDLQPGLEHYSIDLSGLGRNDFFRFISPFNEASKRATDLPRLIQRGADNYGVEWLEFEVLELLGRLSSGRRFSQLLAVLYDCKWQQMNRGGAAWSIKAKRVLIRG